MSRLVTVLVGAVALVAAGYVLSRVYTAGKRTSVEEVRKLELLAEGYIV